MVTNSIKSIFCGLILLLTCFDLVSQQTQRIVTGKVTDVETGEPVPSVTVFINGTTVGTTTDKNGIYQLKLPGAGSYDLTVSHVGYEPVFTKLEINKALIKLDFSLKINELEGATITASIKKMKPREQDVAMFWKRLLGMRPTSRIIYPLKIKEKDISFIYNPETNIFKVSCRVPIEIDNHQTGYRITYILKYFEHNYNSNISNWEGRYFFKEITPKNNKQALEWYMNRKLVYKSTITYFIRSLYQGTLWDDGFLLYYHGRYENMTDSSNKKVVVPYYISSTDSIIHPFLEVDQVLFTNSTNGSKFFFIPADSAVVLFNFGQRITDEDAIKLRIAEKAHIAQGEDWEQITDGDIIKLRRVEKAHTARTEEYWEEIDSVGLFRNYIRTPQPVQIFADGTYSTVLSWEPLLSLSITGLNMVLPLEYGLNTGLNSSNDEITDYSNNDDLSFVYKMDDFMQHHSPEKIYLTTDRPYYAAGDTIWMSAWVLNGGTLEPTEKSRMLHVELIRPDGSILRSVILDAAQGVAVGQFTLPKNIIGDALFRIRAYTRWSLNFDESYRFEKFVPVVQFKDDVWKGPRIEENKNYEWVRLPSGSYAWRRRAMTNDELKITNDELRMTNSGEEQIPALDLQFLPEGGRWVAGFPCRMSFKALAQDGRGVNVEGEIIDDLGETVAEFRSLHQGMGSVFLAPQPGRRYHARLFSGFMVDLPAPDSTGVVMTLQPAREDTLLLQVYFPPETVQKNETFYLIAQSRGMYANTWKLTASRSRVSQFLPVNDFQTGIARFTLFTQDGIPCNERLIFVDREDEIKLQIVSSKGLGRDSSSMILKLQASDAYNLPVLGVFTVSVIDSLYGAHDIRDANLRSQMLLSSDLKGKVEHAGWYFQERDSLRSQMLDLVMQTHGWSGYSWDDVKDVKDAQDKNLYEPEKDYSISGRVTNLRGAGAKDVSVTYLAQGADILVGEAQTDAQGRFSFTSLLPQENTLVGVIAKYQKGRRNALGLGVELDRQPVTPSPPVEEIPPSGGSEAWEELLATYRRKLELDDHYLDNLLDRTDVTIIEEVSITGKRPVKGSWNLNGPGQADHVLYQEDIARYDSFDRLLDVFKAEFPQFYQENWINDELLGRINMPLPNDTEENIKKNMMMIPHSYPIWRYENRTVLFILNGRILPAGLPAEDDLFLIPHPTNDSLRLIALNFWNISTKDITGVEILDSPEYLYPYHSNDIFRYYNPILFPGRGISPNHYDGPSRPILIQVTTLSGSAFMESARIGRNKLRLQGFAIPKAFYIPKYYPDNIFDQAEYDVKPVLYWNPEALTGSDGTAVIQFPVGQKPRELQIRVEGIDLRGGIGSVMQGVVSK